MKIVQSRSFRVGLLIFASALLGFLYKTQSSRSGLAQQATARPIPPAGTAENETDGKVLGHPTNGITDLKQIYTAINIYRRRHGGKFPKIGPLMDDVWDNPKVYGFQTSREAWRIFKNPDSHYADDPVARRRPDANIPYIVSNTRLDGSPLESPKVLGTRDVLAFTDLYYYQNNRIFPGQHSTSNPVGFFLVLWDDGQIEQVPYDKQVFVPEDDLPKNTKPGTRREFKTAFAGQAGIKSNSYSYDEFHQHLGAKKGPRGKAGGKGESYNGLPYR